MSSFLESSVELINDKIMFEGKANSLPAIVIDYIPPLGDGKGYMPLQLFLISLSSCLGGTVAPLIRRMGKTIKGLTIHAKGERHEQHPTGFKKIELEMRIVSDDVADADIDKAIKMAKEAYCPLLSMIKGNVEVSVNYRIVQN